MIAMSRKELSNLQQRVAVALIGIPVLFWLTWQGGGYFFVLVLVLVLSGIYEFHRLAAAIDAPPPLPFLLLWSIVFQTNFFLGLADPLIVIVAAVPLFLLVELFRKGGSRLGGFGSALAVLLYVNLSFGSLLAVRLTGPSGLFSVLLMFVCIWSADIMAYFGGSRFGGRFIRRKFFERISPRKTWEGFLSGCFGSVLGAIIFAAFDSGLHPAFVIGAGVFIGVFSPLGDLVESMFKREAGVKDSSAVIPGHGGVLDRFDTVMFIAPLLYLYSFFAGSLNGQ